MKMILLTEGETMSRLFDLDWQLLADSCLMIIAIFVLFLALSYFLFNPARKFLNDRKEKIRGELEEAKDNQEKAAELKAQYEAKLKDIDKEAEDILSDARRRALQNEERIVTQAKEEAARILARAQEEARLEKRKCPMRSNRRSYPWLCHGGKLVGASIDTTRQNSLIEETLKEMGEDTWQN